jgi:IS30 family transposase
MYKHLTYSELCTIWQHKVNKSINELRVIKLYTIDELAKLLSRHRSTIYRAIDYISANNWSLRIITLLLW